MNLSAASYCLHESPPKKYFLPPFDTSEAETRPWVSPLAKLRLSVGVRLQPMPGEPAADWRN